MLSVPRDASLRRVATAAREWLQLPAGAIQFPSNVGLLRHTVTLPQLCLRDGWLFATFKRPS